MPPSDEFKKALLAGDLPEAFMTAMGKATELNITTRVMNADGNVIAESNPAQTLHTRLDLLNGTIENEVGEEFLSSGQYKDLQHFHQQQVALGNRKIQENFQSLEQLFRLLVTLQQYNRLNNAEEPLDLAFLEVPSHLLPTEKVVKEREQQQAILESFLTPEPSHPPAIELEELETAAEAVIPPTPIAPQRPAPIPPRPMTDFGVAAVAGVAIAKSKGKHQPQRTKPDHSEDEPLNFLDGFAALDLDAERDPIMPVSDLEIDDWEAPAEMSPAQRNAQQTTATYVPSLNDFDHDEPEDDLPDLDDLLGEELDPLADLLEDPSAGNVASSDDAGITTEDFPDEVLEELLETDEIGEEGLGAISLGQASPHAPQEAVDPDLEALLEEADAAHDALEESALFDNLEALPEAIAPEPPELEAEADVLPSETLLAETSFGELLEAADAMTPEMTGELLDETLDEAELSMPDFPDVDQTAIAEPTDAGLENLEDKDLLDFINQDWQSHPDVMEITSLDDEGDPDKALLQPLSTEELAELEEMSRIDDDWQPLAGAGEFSALNLDVADAAQALPVETAENLEADLIDDDWQPLAGKAHETIDIESLLPLELGNEDLESEPEEDFGAIAERATLRQAGTDELDLLNMAEMDLDLEEDLEMPLSDDGGNLGTLDSVDAGSAFEQDDFDLVEIPDEMLDLGEAFGGDFSTDMDGLGDLDGGDEDELLGDAALDDIDGFAETSDDFELTGGDLDGIDEDELLGDAALDDIDGFAETSDDFELTGGDLDGIDEDELLGDAALDDIDGFAETSDDFELAGGDLGELNDLDDAVLDLAGDAPLDGLAENWLGESVDEESEDHFADFNADPMADLANPFVGGAEDDLWEQRGESATFAADDTLDSLSDDVFSAEMDIDGLGTDEAFDALGDLDSGAIAMDGDTDDWLEQFDETDGENDDFGLGSDLAAEDEFGLGTDDEFGENLSSAIAMDGDTDNWLDQFDETDGENDDFGLGSDLAAADQDLSENFGFDGALSDEVLNSISELDEATADLLSLKEGLDAGENLDEDLDENLFDELDTSAISVFADPETEDTLGDLGMGDEVVAAMPFTSSLAGGLDDSSWDADLDADLLDPDLEDDAPIDLEIKDLSDGDFALTGFDDGAGLGAAAIAGTEDGWDNLAETTNDQSDADWGELAVPVSQEDNDGDWGIADLEGLGDFDSGDLSGLADFDLEALESDDSDDDFDLFGNEDSETLNPFFESKP